MAKIGELVVFPCSGAFCFSGVGWYAYLEPLASLLFSFCIKRKIYPLLKPSSGDFSELSRPGGKWKVIKFFQDLGNDLFSLFVTSEAVQFAGFLPQKTLFANANPQLCLLQKGRIERYCKGIKKWNGNYSLHTFVCGSPWGNHQHKKQNGSVSGCLGRWRRNFISGRLVVWSVTCLRFHSNFFLNVE